MKRIHVYILAFLIAGCNANDSIVDEKNFAHLISNEKLTENKKLQQIDADLKFWKDRLQKQPGDIVSQTKIASILSGRFTHSGNIHDLHTSDSLYTIANKLNKFNSSSTYRSLARNCITQHKFRQAKLYIDSALALGDDKFISVLMSFDVEMELGNFYAADKALKMVSDKTSFAYLIRKAKYEDHVRGDLDKAIVLMEQAAEKFDRADLSLYLWTYSNLGDMYGHANRFKEAYQCYLDVLKKDPEHSHSLKGIAWLAFSHDKNIPAAKKIISFLQKKHPVPDYELFLAEIAGYENNTAAMQQHLQAFNKAVANPLFGDMYNKYLYNVKADMLNDVTGAIAIAKTEVNNRPTADSYSLLAWSYYKSGDLKQSLYIAKNYVEKRCFEPEALFRLGLIYKASGDAEKAIKYLQMAKESSFELGPLTAAEIDEALKTI